MWELIGERTIALNEYTDTANEEITDTGINIINTDYAVILTTITCDTEPTTATEWGYSVAIGGRYTTNNAYNAFTSFGYKGVRDSVDFSGVISTSANWASYGVRVPNNTANITIGRKCHGTGCPKIRAGNYTIKVYGLKSL